jgi:hypothetical protein
MKNKIFGFILLVLVAIFCISNSAYASDWKEGKDVSLIHEEEQKGGQPSTKQKTEKEEIPISKEAEEIVRAISDWAQKAKTGVTARMFDENIIIVIYKTTTESTWSKNQVRYYRWEYTKFEPLPEALQKGLSAAGRMQQPPGGSLRPVGYTWTTPGRTTSVRLLDYCRYYFSSTPYGDKVTYRTRQTQTIILGDILGNGEISEEVKRKLNEMGGKWTESQTVETGRQKDVPVGPTQTHVAEGPGDVEVGKDKELQTTSRVIFSREYVYTDDIIDAITDKGFELEVVYDFTANTTIKEIFIPVHIITRYQNMGTMTITPVDWSWRFYDGNKSVRIWAKFKYPKAAVPGRSPMLFRVRVNTKDGTRVVSDQIDVPVNTLNGRFTDVPESETGELYPIKGLYKVNNREYLKNFGAVNHAGIYVQ